MITSDIVVTMPKSFGISYLYKKNRALIYDGTAWWNMKRIPKRINLDSKIFIVCDGEIEQYYTINDIDEFDKKIYIKSYHNIKKIKMKGFQGFRYRNFAYQEL